MTQETEPVSSGSTSNVSIDQRFKKMPAAEKLLAVAAAVVLLGFIFQGQWSYLFHNYFWFQTFCFVGSVLTLALIGTRMFGVKVLDAKMYMPVLVILALLPALGFVINALSGSVWQLLMYAGMVAMAVAGAKITSREHLIR